MNESFIATHEEPKRAFLFDVFATVGVIVFSLLFLSGLGGLETNLILIPTTLLFLIRRIAPITFLWLATVMAGVGFGMGFAGQLFLYVIVLIGVYGTAAFSPKRLRLLGFVPLALAMIAAGLDVFTDVLADSGSNFMFAESTQPDSLRNVFLSTAIISTIAFVAAWALGMLRRSQLMAVVRQRERADLFERDAHRLAELAVSEERTRISREMHDIIAHSLASILTLAEGGRMGTKQPGSEYSHELFNKISSASRDALNEVKVLLKQVDQAQEDAPAYGVADIADLVETTKLAGLPLDYFEDGEARSLPSGHSLAVYRIAQESITNILKHTPGQKSVLALHWGENGVSLVTRNAVPERYATDGESHPEGKGLVGMRERAELFDGVLQIRRAANFFEIRADLPYPSTEK